MTDFKHRGTIIVFFLIIIFVAMRFLYQAFLSTPRSEKLVNITITASSTLLLLAEELEAKQIIGSARAYRVYGWLDRSVRFAKPGTYPLLLGMSFHTIARKLALGPERNEIEARLIEGKTLDQEMVDLQEQYGVGSEVFASLAGHSLNQQPFDLRWRKEFSFLRNLPKYRSLEGYLYPDTYRVWEDQLPEGLIRKQLQEFEKQFGEFAELHFGESRLSFDQIVILASIVEKEVSREEDRKMVAGIFLRRLSEGMLLQSDATLSYLTSSNRSRANRNDLALDSAFNSYKYFGLPPSPICQPSAMSIRAAVQPTPSLYRFFVTDANGRVFYGRTYEEHVRNVRRAGY